MEKMLKNRRFFNIITLICLAGFLISPNICLADDFDNIDLREMGKYLELPQKDARQLIDTLKQVLTTEGALLWSSTYASDEEIAAVVTLLKATKIQALNRLLVDAPIEITWGIVKGAIEISRMLLDPSGASAVFNKIEKETVQRAVNYGMSFLLENEIRVSPGAIEFEYFSYKGDKKEIIFQYIMLYKSIRNTNKAELEIRFYMPHFIEAPDPQQYKGITSIPVPDLKKDISPFIIEIKGIVEKTQFDNYWWIDAPLLIITFPPEVPDLGIKPLSVWEKYLLKPIESTIKDVEIIITKVTGQSLGLTDMWEGIKSFISGITNLSPAAILSPSEEKDAEQTAIIEESVPSAQELDIAPTPSSILTPISPPPPASDACAGVRT